MYSRNSEANSKSVQGSVQHVKCADSESVLGELTEGTVVLIVR